MALGREPVLPAESQAFAVSTQNDHPGLQQGKGQCLTRTVHPLSPTEKVTSLQKINHQNQRGKQKNHPAGYIRTQNKGAPI